MGFLWNVTAGCEFEVNAQKQLPSSCAGNCENDRYMDRPHRLPVPRLASMQIEMLVFGCVH